MIGLTDKDIPLCFQRELAHCFGAPHPTNHNICARDMLAKLPPSSLAHVHYHAGGHIVPTGEADMQVLTDFLLC